MKQGTKFILRGIAFLLPLALIWSGAVFRSGEMTDWDDAIRMQLQDTGILYGPTYTENYFYYRAEATRQIEPEVLIIGDSRVAYMRSFFFNQPEKVYNACWGALSTADMEYFLKSQPAGSIKTVIFALNHAEFNKNYITVEYPDEDVYTKKNPPPSFGEVSLSMLTAWKNGSLSLPEVWFTSGRVGLGAVVSSSGMMSDGSLYPGGELATIEKDPNPELRMAGVRWRIETGQMRFEYGDVVDAGAVQHLDSLLSYCKSQDIQVICYLPSYAPSINVLMEEYREQYGYHFALAGTVAPLFEKYGFEFYDYTDATVFGCDDSYFMDGFHGGDALTVRMMLDMMEKGSALGGLCSKDALWALYEGRSQNHVLFGSLEEYQSRLPVYDV